MRRRTANRKEEALKRTGSQGAMAGVFLATLLGLGVGGDAFFLGPGTAAAARTRFFTAEGYESFRKLELNGVELSEDGRVRPGWTATALEGPEARTVWRIVPTRGGIAAATGDQGQVYLVSGADSEILATLYNYEIFALAGDDAGTIFAAGAPSGAIVAIDRSGTERTLFTVPEGLVFDLSVGPDGHLYVASGERGRIYRVRLDGTADVVAETGDAHARRMAWARDGQSLWVGTNGRGLLERIDPGSGGVQIVYDCSEEEVVDLVPREDGSWLFAANPAPGAGGERPADGESAPGPRPTLYEVTKDGSVRRLWSTAERTIQCILPEADGSVLVATGRAGTVYRVDGSGRETILWRAEEEQILTLVRDGETLYAGTGNPGRIYRLGPARTESASLLSDVLDAGDQARWGKLTWRAEGNADAIRLETRSGFTAVPDETWSSWNDVPAGGGQIGSPAGRYIQWRATLAGGEGSAPTLRSVRLPYLVSNRRPVVSQLTLSSREAGYRAERNGGGISQVLPGGVQVDYSLGSGSRPANTLPPEGVPSWVQQLRSIVWTAEDPDADALAYRLEIRQVGEEDFRSVARDLRDPAYTLETGLLPNGTYELRVTASDAPGNAPGEELEAVRVSPPFQIDNLAPVVADLRARRSEETVLVSGRARDADSPLRAIEVSIDGGAFQGVHPADGLLDSEEEDFEVAVPLEDPQGGGWVVVQVRDAAGNEGVFRAWLEP